MWRRQSKRKRQKNSSDMCEIMEPRSDDRGFCLSTEFRCHEPQSTGQYGKITAPALAILTVLDFPLTLTGCLLYKYRYKQIFRRT